MFEGLWHVICDFSEAESVAGLYLHLCEAQAPWQRMTLKSLKLNRRTECVTCSRFSFPPHEVSGVDWGQTKWMVWGGTLLGGWLWIAECVSPNIATKGGRRLTSFWLPTGCTPLAITPFLILYVLIQYYIWLKQIQEYISLWYLAVTAFSAWMRKRTKCQYLLKKIKYGMYFSSPLFIVIYISQFFQSLCASEKLWIPNSLEVHSICYYSSRIQDTAFYMTVICLIFSFLVISLLPSSCHQSKAFPLCLLCFFCFQFCLNL